MLALYGNKIAIIPFFDPDEVAEGKRADGTSWKIIAPEQSKERSDQGIVKYVGPKVKEIQIGDYVIFSGYTGTALRIEGEGVLLIMQEDFIVARLEGTDIDSVDVPGLYFIGTDGVYFQANYELAMDLIGRAVSEVDWRQKFSGSKIEYRPKPEAIKRGE